MGSDYISLLSHEAHLVGLGVLYHPSQMQTCNGAERRFPHGLG
jgi:hypothetical protein